MDITSPPPPEVQGNIILNEIEMYRNTRFQLQIRYRVNKGIGNDSELPAITAQLERVEKSLEYLQKEYDALEKKEA